MKKIALFLTVLMLLAAFAGCVQNAAVPSADVSEGPVDSADASDEPAEPSDEVSEAERVTVSIATMKGPTGIGLVQVMESAEKGTAANDYVFTLAGAADEITPALIKGEIDIAAIPANLASVLYNKTEGKISVIAINTLGVLYIVDKGGEVAKLEDLRGKTVYATGKGSTPEYTLRYILAQNGIDPDNDVNIEFKSEAGEVVSTLAASEKGVAMLPQPYVATALSKVEGLNVVVDLNDEWGKVCNDTDIITGVAVVRKEFAEAHPEAVKKFLEEYSASVEYVNANVDEASALVEKFGIVAAAAVAKKAIPQCNITFVTGDRMKEQLKVYLGVLYEANAKSVGEKLPSDDFYYSEK